MASVIWQWVLGLLRNAEPVPVPEDVRYHESEHKRAVDDAASMALRVADSRINSGSHSASP